MKAGLLILICAAFAAAQENWFSEVVSGIQEGIKESFEETQKKLIKTHLENAEKNEGVKGFLKRLSKHMDEWQKHYAKKYAVNGSQALNRKAKKLWKKIQVHVIKKLQSQNGTALDRHELSKLYVNGEKIKKKIMKKIKNKQEKKENKIKKAKKPELHRVPLLKDEVIGAKRLMKAQKLFKKLSNMWSKALDEKRREYHLTERMPETEKEEAEPSPETITEEHKEAKGLMSVLSNPQEIAKRVMKYADMVKRPTPETPKEEVPSKGASLFFQMRKPKNRETGPHFSKEEEEAIRKVFKSTILRGKEADPITSSEAEAERAVKEEEKKFEEREKEWEATVRERQEKMTSEKKVFPSIKDIPSKTILPAFIKMESLPGHRDEKPANANGKNVMRKDIEETKHAAEDKDSIPVGDNEHMILLPNMHEEEGKSEKMPESKMEEPHKATPEAEEKQLPPKPKPDNEELWIKFPDTGKKSLQPVKVANEQFEKMDGDLPASLEEDYEQKGEEEKKPEEPVMVEPKEDVHPTEKREPTMNPRDLQEMDDEGFRKRLMQEEEQWAQFKKNLMAKFERMNQKVNRRPWQAIRDLGARLPGKFKGVIHGFNKEAEKKANYEEP